MKQAGRIVIITGAAGGIGHALVDTLAAGGDTVVAVDLPGSGVLELARGLGPAHLGLEFDVSREEDIPALYDRIERQFGHIGVLVNNAAIGPTMAATVDTTIDGFRRILAVNLIGPIAMAREVAGRIGSGAVIVNVASLAGVLGNPKRNAYAASKAGLISFTKSLSWQFASCGIRVAAVAPGYVRTPMVSELERAGKIDLAAVRSRVPMGRVVRPDEIARAVRFLASAQASYITGSVLTVDGGWRSSNQPGEAHPPVPGTPRAELFPPAEHSTARIALVIGGADCIGAAVARRFAENGDACNCRQRWRCSGRACRFPRWQAYREVRGHRRRNVVALFEELRRHFGRLDVLVNNAANYHVLEVEQMPTEIEPALTGAFTCAREAIKVMRRGNLILNLGPNNTLLPFAPRHAYDAFGAGMEILTRRMAAELGPVGIRTATVAPGYIHTPAVAKMEKLGHVDPKAIRRRIPMGRMGRPEDVADQRSSLHRLTHRT